MMSVRNWQPPAADSRTAPVHNHLWREDEKARKRRVFFRDCHATAPPSFKLRSTALMQADAIAHITILNAANWHAAPPITHTRTSAQTRRAQAGQAWVRSSGGEKGDAFAHRLHVMGLMTAASAYG
jgi:hypothetical protein